MAPDTASFAKWYQLSRLGLALGLHYHFHMRADDRILDERTMAALGRLTEREKDCLRRWMRHQTAKEMALELGVTPHAVEKRLKMARAKLGASNSLDAARLLAIQERYDWTGPHLPDLGRPDTKIKQRPTTTIVLGIIAMGFLAVTSIAILVTSAAPGTNALMSPKPGEVVLVAPQPFETLDADQSGFLEGKETPVLVKFGGNVVYESKSANETEISGEYVELAAGNYRDQFYSEADTDGDGKVSRDEYRVWSIPKPAGGQLATDH